MSLSRMTKTGAELEAMVMAELRRHPECEGILGVKIDPISMPNASWSVTVIRH